MVILYFFNYLLLGGEWNRELPWSCLKLATVKQNLKTHILYEYSQPLEPENSIMASDKNVLNI